MVKKWPYRSSIIGVSEEPIVQSCVREAAAQCIDALVNADQQMEFSERQRFLLDYAVSVLQQRLKYRFLRVVDEELEIKIGRMEAADSGFAIDYLVGFASVLSALTPTIEEVKEWTETFKKLRTRAAQSCVGVVA